MSDPTWIIVCRPGLVPDRKGPLPTPKLVEDMLRGLYALYPDCLCIVIDMPHTSYPQSAREWLDMYGDKRRKELPRRALCGPPGVGGPDGETFSPRGTHGGGKP